MKEDKVTYVQARSSKSCLRRALTNLSSVCGLAAAQALNVVQSLTFEGPFPGLSLESAQVSNANLHVRLHPFCPSCAIRTVSNASRGISLKIKNQRPNIHRKRNVKVFPFVQSPPGRRYAAYSLSLLFAAARASGQEIGAAENWSS
jgi:hypothetical protein